MQIGVTSNPVLPKGRNGKNASSVIVPPLSSLCSPTTIDNKRRASHKGCLVRSQVERSICDLIRSAHPSNRLACVKLLAHLVLMSRKVSCEIPLHERSMHSTRTDSVAANSLCDEINGD